MEHPFTEEQVRLIERDLLDFIRGKGRLNQLRRWVMTQQDELTARKAAEFIASKFQVMLFEGWTAV